MKPIFFSWYKWLSLAIALLAALAFLQFNEDEPAIRIGVLHSLTGTMATSEAPLVDAIRLAVEEANEAGGVTGRRVEMVVEDCRSDAAYCAERAEKLIVHDKVQVLFGCWTSTCRKEVRGVVEKHRHLLFYPVQYEGLEQSNHIVYTGAVPNQQIIPMGLWALQNKGRRFYLIGSDYIFPRTANMLLKDVLEAQGGRLLGERYVSLGAGDLSEAVREIVDLRPDFVLNTLNGESNRHLFRMLREAGISADEAPVFSTSIGEVELATMGHEAMAGHYAAWNYFQSLDTPKNRAFIERFRQRFGRERVIGDPMVASYVGVRLWLDAVSHQHSTDPAMVRNCIVQDSIASPGGIAAVDYVSNHLWKTVYIGQMRPNGQFDIVWQTSRPVRPMPFPFYRSRDDWLKLQGELSGDSHE